MSPSVELAVTILLGIFGGGALTSLLQFFITRHDDKNGHYKEIIERLDDFDKKLEATREDILENRATNARIRILEFSDDLHHGIKRSKESFDQIHQDIDNYNMYCKEHPKYENSRAMSAIEHIKRVYSECLENDGFLE